MPRDAGRLWAALRHGLILAAANLLQQKLRLAVAVAGTAVAILLLILQMALLQAVGTEVTRLYDDFDFDVALVPATYQFLYSPGQMDRIRLSQAREIPGVDQVFGLNVGSASWSGHDSRQQFPVLLIGIDGDPGFVRDAEIRKGRQALRASNAVLIDRFSNPRLAPFAVGDSATLSDTPVDIAGQFRLGLFFYADGSVIVDNANYARYGNDARLVTMGLVRAAPGTDPAALRAALAARLPPDVRAMTRQELVAQERAFFLSVKPIGLMVSLGMVIAALAAFVILWQVLSVEIARRSHEFAALRAIGFGRAFVFGVGFAETLGLCLASLAPALLAGGAILWLIEALTHLPTAITPGLAAAALGIAVLLSLLSSLHVLARIARADPVQLFR